MKTKITVILSLILISTAYFVVGHKSIPNKAADFRDAPRDDFATSGFGDLAATTSDLKAAASAETGSVKAAPVQGTSSPVSTVRERKTEWVNKNCRETDTCDLKRLSLIQRDYKVKIGDSTENFGTRMVLEYETAKLGSLERYGIAQFIRGCQFHSKRQPDGEVLKDLDVTRFWNGEDVTYRHPNWVLDRVTPDPIDWGFEENSPNRHFYYWNSFPGSIPGGQNYYYGYKKPVNPVLYLRDLPGAAFLSPVGAKNISLQFRVCIYKSADVPLEVSAYNLDFAKPLTCLEWSSSWIYNHAKGRYEQPVDIDPVCQ